jgi:hypothetical protein
MGRLDSKHAFARRTKSGQGKDWSAASDQAAMAYPEETKVTKNPRPGRQVDEVPRRRIFALPPTHRKLESA